MATAVDRARQAVESLADLGVRSATNLSARLRRVRASLLLIVQSGVAAGLAWYVAHDLIGHPSPFFAPVSAVIVLGVAVGQRWRRAIELVLGVALGILVGDVLIYLIGTGVWQVALVVALAISTAIMLGGSPTVVGQAASSAVLVSTLALPGIYYSRFVDALVGGAVGLVVMALLLPLNPLTTVRRAAQPVLDLLAAELAETAEALEHGSRSESRGALDQLRSTEPRLVNLRNTLSVATETASLAPARWRSRAPLAQYVDASVHIDRAVRNARVLARRSVSAIEDGEAIPATLPRALRTLADSVTVLRAELAAGVEPRRARSIALSAVAEAADAYATGVGFSGGVVVAQIRSTASDILRATGLEEGTSTRAVRRAVGRLAP